MIEVDKVKQQLDNYIKNYDINNPQIKLKKSHSIRVSQLSKHLATSLKLDKENIALAEVIGFLHDIGRFEQVKRYNTFIDKNSINHGQLGVDILFKEGLIRNFIETDKYDSIIKAAIINHNKLSIPENISDLEYIHSQIIRDCDKTDILFLSSLNDKDDVIFETKDLKQQLISDLVYDDFINNYKIDYSNISTKADITLCHLAYIFDYNFNEMLKFIDNKGYIDKFYKRINFFDKTTQERFDNSYKTVKTYIKYRKSC